MATAAVAVTVTSNKMARIKAATLNWLEWKEAGKAPRSREAALKVISGKVGVDATAIRESIARNFADEQIDDRLSYIVWDIQENGCQLDYNRAVDAIVSDLLMQASDCIYRYTRTKVSLQRVMDVQTSLIRKLVNTEAPTKLEVNSRAELSVPTVLSIPGTGATRISSLPKDLLETVAQAFVQYAVRSLLRWKAMGCDREYIRRVLHRVEEEVLNQF